MSLTPASFSETHCARLRATSLDRAVTTTFSLDLMALLTIPVSFTFFELKDHDGPPTVDPLVLLEALRRYAGRLTVFCQAGQIYVPRQVQLLLGNLEDSVQQVRAPRGGVFHPKLTVLRYAAETATTVNGGNAQPPVVYRVLCSSRNLTFDRSWDTLLALNGPLIQTSTNAFARNRPLSRFVAALPALAVYPMAAARVAEVQAMADELLRVDFELPNGFDEMAFCPLGVDGAADRASEKWPILRHRRTLAMAPFVDEGFVRKFGDDVDRLSLISRAESLDELSLDCLGRMSDAWYMSTAADPVPDDSEASALSTGGVAEGATATDSGLVELVPSIQLHGLHAKLFVCDDGWDAHVYTGSANATMAAFERNVEFLVHLTGRKKGCGINALLARCDDGHAGGKDKAMKFADLLVPYRRETEAAAESAQKAIERLLDETRYALAGGGITGSVEAVPADDGGAEARYRVSLVRGESVPIVIPEGVTVNCHPLSLKPSNSVQATSPVGESVALFGPLSFDALTSFYAFRLTARAAGVELSCGFVINVPLTGAPADRAGRLLLSLLRNRAQLLRYLLMLLADDEDDARRLVEALAAADFDVSRTDGQGGGFGLPLLVDHRSPIDG